MKHKKFTSIRFTFRREFSLWACLFAVVFQLGAPLVQAAVFNQVLAAQFSHNGIVPIEICMANGSIANSDPSRVPVHNNPTCDVCTVYNFQHLDVKAILSEGYFNSAQQSTASQVIAHAADTVKPQFGFASHAIRAPPFFL